MLLVALATLTLRPAHALLLPDQAAAGQVRVYSLWNQEYLCLAARVPDTMITGTSEAPMSTPEQDDAVEFDFEVQGQSGLEAHRLIIGAAGGMTVYTRDTRGQWRADPSWIGGPRTLKFAVSAEGSLNNPGDRDTGYVVECAIPWQFLGTDEPLGREIGFNVTVWMQGENESIASWSPSVREPGQVGDAARWGRIAIGGGGLVSASGAWMPCPYSPQMPFIDGKLSATEWLTAGTLEFGVPEAAIEAAPVAAERTGVVGTIAAIYRYDWQGGVGATPGASFWAGDSPATANQPRVGAGPWVSYGRVDWHSAELAEVQRAGIDIILARYSGDDAARSTWALTGLGRLSQALKQRRAQGQGYPLVGMMLDTTALRGVDLRGDAGRRRLYGMVREFFLRVPREFWAQLGARPAEGLRGGVPVLLGEPDGLAGWDASFVQYCDQQFARDFAGARIVWLGSSAWRTERLNFYSYIALPTRSGFAASTPEGARVAAISPGRVPPPGQAGEIRPRMEGKSYRSDWQRSLAMKPELVIIDSWNDFANGTELSPSRQYGVMYVDITRLFQSRLGSQEPQNLWLKQERVPTVIAPGAECQAEFVVENTGTESLRTGPRLSADYTIARRSDGALVRKRQAIQELNIAAGQTQRLPITIPARGDKDEPLPPGDYLFTFGVTRSSLAYVRSSWFAHLVAKIEVPFSVGAAPDRKAALVSSSLPAVIESGATATVVVRLRNDGRLIWRQGKTAVSYHWAKCSDDAGTADQIREVLALQGPKAQLPKDVPPGAMVSVMIPVSAVADGGQPLPPSGPDAGWHYRLQWDLAEGDRWFSQDGGAAGDEAIEVIATDPGVLFESVRTPAEMTAGESVDVSVTVANAGAHMWKAAESAITSQWYAWDGRTSTSSPTVTSLSRDVAPGERAVTTASLAAPTMPGPYWVAWRMATSGGEDLSTGTREDLVVAPVLVRSDSMYMVDLSQFGNLPGIAVDSYRARGDFDRRGDSLPAEWLPPDQTGPREPVYPAGYYSPGVQSAGVPFAYPDVSAGVGTVVGCSGQRIGLGDRGAVRIHLLAASTEGDQPAVFRIVLQSGEVEETTLVVPGWSSQAAGAEVAAYTPYVRTLTTDDATRQAYLYHLSLTPKGRATALELPSAPWARIVAITTETK